VKVTLIALLLQGIPESIALVTLAFVIAKISIRWDRIILFGTGLAFCMYLVRQLPLPFGLHIIVNIILLFIVLLREGKGDFSLALISSLSSDLSLIILEAACTSLIINIFGVTLSNLSINSGIWILMGEPQVLLLFCLAFLLNKFYLKRGQNNGFFISK